MTASIVGLLSLALSFANFGIEANPNAPKGEDVVHFAPKKADVMVYLDVEALVPKNYAALQELANNRELNRFPDLKREMTAAMNQLEMGIRMVKGAVQVDPTKDIKTVAAWVIYRRKGEPNFLVHIRGDFPPGFIANVASASGQSPIRVGGRPALVDDGIMLASAADGSLLFGSPTLVKPRASARKKRRRPGATSRRAASILNAKPFFSLISTPSAAAISRLMRELAGADDNALRDLISGHRFAALSMHHDGMRWTYTAKSRTGLGRAEHASRGVLHLMRASHHAGRGIAHILFASIDSYRGRDKKIDAIIAVKKDLMKLVEEYTGDGKFEQKVDMNPGRKTLTVTARGRSLSDVVPLVGTIPFAAGAAFILSATQPR